MLLRNNLEGQNALDQAILSYYKRTGDRHVRIFSHGDDLQADGCQTSFLLERKHVIRYGVAQDRGSWLAGLELGIGPHYFGAADFWSYKDSQRFTLEATTEGVERNLALLDEFFAGM